MKWIVAGWLLFIVSALFFIAAAWRAGDMLALSGGVFFLIACFSFLVPIVRKEHN
ncbi:MAG TPA: cytochrome oxidase subunit III [Rhizobiaceae bacterium]|nr:cytochrome oxidase subunit III [Rhizobiaceae bacterium]